MIRAFDNEDARYSFDEWCRTILQSNRDLEEPLDSVAQKTIVGVARSEDESRLLLAGHPWVMDRATPTAVLTSEYATNRYPFETETADLRELAVNVLADKLREIQNDD